MRIIRPNKDLSTYLRILVNKFASKDLWQLPQSSKAECLLCRADFKRVSNPASDMLCQGCWQDLPWNTEACATCALPMPQTVDECAACLTNQAHYSQTHYSKTHYSHMHCPLRYEFPADVLIKNYKYRSMRYYLPLLEDIIKATIIVNTPLLEQLDAVIAVPQDPKRAKERPYHVASKLAQTISKLSGLPLLTGKLIKIKSSPAQASLDKAQRLSNLRRCFEIKGDIPERILLVDDVVTTGATAETLASLLRDNGAEHIEVWALARTPSPKH